MKTKPKKTILYHHRLTCRDRWVIRQFLTAIHDDFDTGLQRLRSERKKLKTKAIDRHIDYYDHAVKACRYGLATLEQRETLRVYDGKNAER